MRRRAAIEPEASTQSSTRLDSLPSQRDLRRSLRAIESRVVSGEERDVACRSAAVRTVAAKWIGPVPRPAGTSPTVRPDVVIARERRPSVPFPVPATVKSRGRYGSSGAVTDTGAGASGGGSSWAGVGGPGRRAGGSGGEPAVGGGVSEPLSDGGPPGPPEPSGPGSGS